MHQKGSELKNIHDRSSKNVETVIRHAVAHSSLTDDLLHELVYIYITYKLIKTNAPFFHAAAYFSHRLNSSSHEYSEQARTGFSN